MITDEMLREAAAEYERYMLAHLPEITEPHLFSKRFERKMQKLISRARHPVLYHVKRYVAAVLLAIITLFGTVIALSPEARAAVIGWVRSTVAEYFQYTSKNTGDSIANEYELSVLPEGYKQIGIIQKVDGAAYLFTDGSGNILQFSCRGCRMIKTNVERLLENAKIPHNPYEYDVSDDYVLDYTQR